MAARQSDYSLVCDSPKPTELSTEDVSSLQPTLEHFQNDDHHSTSSPTPSSTNDRVQLSETQLKALQHPTTERSSRLPATRPLLPPCGGNPSQKSSPSSGCSVILPSYLINPNGLCCRRVEDVRLNRIDNPKNGRRRRRPFVFKSSPLAEGQGINRITTSFSYTSASSSTQQLHPLTRRKVVDTGNTPAHPSNSPRGSLCISRFAESLHRPATIIFTQENNNGHQQEPLGILSSSSPSHFPLISNCWTKQPQISARLRHASNNDHHQQHSQQEHFKSLSQKRTTIMSKTNDYQSWEISLPTCSLPKSPLLSMI